MAEADASKGPGGAAGRGRGPPAAGEAEPRGGGAGAAAGGTGEEADGGAEEGGGDQGWGLEPQKQPRPFPPKPTEPARSSGPAWPGPG